MSIEGRWEWADGAANCANTLDRISSDEWRSEGRRDLGDDGDQTLTGLRVGFGDDDDSVTHTGSVKRVESQSDSGPDKGLLNTWLGLNDQSDGSAGGSATGISVNGYLWRAALDDEIDDGLMLEPVL